MSEFGSVGGRAGGDRDDLRPHSPADPISDRIEPNDSRPARHTANRQTGVAPLLPPTPDAESDSYVPAREDQRGFDTEHSPRATLLPPAGDAPDVDPALHAQIPRTHGGRERSGGGGAEGESNERGTIDGVRNAPQSGIEPSGRGGAEQAPASRHRIADGGPPRLVRPAPGREPEHEDRSRWGDGSASDGGWSEDAQRLRSSSLDDRSGSREAVHVPTDERLPDSGDERHGTMRATGRASTSVRANAEGHRRLLPEIAPDARIDDAVSPLPIPRHDPGRESSVSRTVNVTIGRVEVRGAPERKSPPARQRPQRQAAPPTTPAMSLDDYLKRYNRREG